MKCIFHIYRQPTRCDAFWRMGLKQQCKLLNGGILLARVTDALASLHWLRSSERIQYKLATTVFRSLHGLTPPYLSDDLHRLVDMPSRRRLRSASSLQLDVPRTHHRTVGDRAFAATGPTLWNSLPHDITD